MTRKLTSRQRTLSILADYYGVTFKEIDAGAGLPPKTASQYLRRAKKIQNDAYARILGALNCPPAAVWTTQAYLDSMDSLHSVGEFTAEERAEIERAVCLMTQKFRQAVEESVRRSRAQPLTGYPDAHAVSTLALQLFGQLEKLPQRARLAIVRTVTAYQSWALCERVCEASVEELSRNLDRAAAWARLAREIADHVRGPLEWRNRVRGFAGAFEPNVLRVRGELVAADLEFEAARHKWRSGSDPDQVLDPGRLASLAASLRIDQGRLQEALVLLDEAVATSRCPNRALIKKGILLDEMGNSALAIDTLLQVSPRINRRTEPRLGSILDFSLATSYCEVRRFGEAARLVFSMRRLAGEMGDQIALIRMDWLEGRILAGLGRRAEARELLANARRAFDRLSMSYDVALALLEEAIMLLEDGRPREVKALVRDLAKVFESKGVHREALAALRLFQEAADREEASVELARKVSRYLLRARHNQSLRFES